MKNKAIDKEIEKIVRKVSIERSKIIDDFAMVYCAGRKLTAKQIKRLELVERRTENGAIFSFRLKRGKRPYSKKSRSNKLKNKNYYHWWESDQNSG